MPARVANPTGPSPIIAIRKGFADTAYYSAQKIKLRITKSTLVSYPSLIIP